VHRKTLALKVAPPFHFPTLVRSHGWFDLLPNEWDEGREVLRTALVLDGAAVDVDLRHPGDRIIIQVPKGGCELDGMLLRRAVARMLSLDQDLQPFWTLCSQHAELRWVARRGAGRLLRAPTLFEDLFKILLTTNCTWAQTRNMVRSLIDSLGPRTEGGRAAFPTAAAIGAKDEKFFRVVVRVGYRAKACIALAREIEEGRLDEATLAVLPDDELARRLRSLPGFGPYAVGQAMRLLGRFQPLALDSWCRKRLQEVMGRSRPPSDRQIARRYRDFEPFCGLALWMELTAPWHRDENPRPFP